MSVFLTYCYIVTYCRYVMYHKLHKSKSSLKAEQYKCFIIRMSPSWWIPPWFWFSNNNIPFGAMFYLGHCKTGRLMRGCLCLEKLLNKMWWHFKAFKQKLFTYSLRCEYSCISIEMLKIEYHRRCYFSLL